MAEAAGVLVNVVDQTEACGFITPSIVDRGDVVIGISTAGSSPVLARSIREQIERLLPARVGDLAAFAREFREAVKAKFPFSQRRKFWEKFFQGPIAQSVLDGRLEDAHQEMLVHVNQEGFESRQGRVYIVGTGPGDPDLLTLRAMHIMQQADVVLYDRLIGPEILSYVRRDAELVFAGKQRNNHHLSQDQIQEKMAEQALLGKTVVRLKGGDPFVFGRGGEELDFLTARGVSVEVVPGITAALGCATAAHVPLTHRNHSQAVTFVTAYGKGGSDIDWDGLVRLPHTLVFYMGVSRAALISNNLVSAGLDACTPVAIIENGSLPEQRVVRGELHCLERLVRDGNVKGPAIIIVGDVARFGRDSELGDMVGKEEMAASSKRRQIA